MLSYIPDGIGTILEIGCGEGDFGSLIKEKYKVEYWGVDINKKALDIASNNLDKTILANFNIENKSLPYSYFDCIVFNDSLEHLYEPWDVLHYCNKLLRPNGYIVCSIPNVRYIDNLCNMVLFKEWKYEDEGILDRTHYRFFTENSIKKLFNSSGYKIELIEGINEKKKLKRIEKNLFRLLKINGLLSFRKKYIIHNDIKYMQFAVVAKKKCQ